MGTEESGRGERNEKKGEECGEGREEEEREGKEKSRVEKDEKRGMMEWGQRNGE